MRGRGVYLQVAAQNKSPAESATLGAFLLVLRGASVEHVLQCLVDLTTKNARFEHLGGVTTIWEFLTRRRALRKPRSKTPPSSTKQVGAIPWGAALRAAPTPLFLLASLLYFVVFLQ